MPLDVELMPEDRLTSELEDSLTREEWLLPSDVEELPLPELLDSEPIVPDLPLEEGLLNLEPSVSEEPELVVLES